MYVVTLWSSVRGAIHLWSLQQCKSLPSLSNVILLNCRFTQSVNRLRTELLTFIESYSGRICYCAKLLLFVLAWDNY